MSAQASKKLLNVLKGNQEAVPPIWLMRQAGRYLPEYRALRAEKGGFLALAYDSDAATEITLQPIKRFGFDGAILFSDILVIPHAMGQDLWFETGEGPRLTPRLAESRLEEFVPAPERLAPVIDTVRKVSAALPAETTFLGFAGSPWTVATYMVHGQGSKDQAEARRMAHAEPERFAGLIEAIISATVDYLANQIDAGVDAVQLFDSWAGFFVASTVPKMGHRAKCGNRASFKSAQSECCHHWLSPKARAVSLPLMLKAPALMHWDWMKRLIRIGQTESCQKVCRCRAILIHSR
jgi:uroporphyrinogen decarboxylase